MDALGRRSEDIEISPASATESDVAALIDRHVALMRSQSPAEACHVMTANSLSEADIQIFVVRQAKVAVSIGALKRFDGAGEIKSMHTVAEARGQGHARSLLRVLLEHARAQGIREVFLETGAGEEHKAARLLYAAEGFRECPAFGAYKPHPLSLYMMRVI